MILRYVKPIGIFCLVFCFAGCISRANRISQEVVTQNRQLPQMLTDSLRVDSLAFSKEMNTLAFYYTVLGNPSEFSFDYTGTQKDIAGAIRNSPSMAKFRNQKVTFQYVYLSEYNKSVLTKIEVPYSEYR